jgi:hypothetical protein
VGVFQIANSSTQASVERSVLMIRTARQNVRPAFSPFRPSLKPPLYFVERLPHQHG